jgi:hypothetical protein
VEPASTPHEAAVEEEVDAADSAAACQSKASRIGNDATAQAPAPPKVGAIMLEASRE